MTSTLTKHGWLRRTVCAMLIASLGACSTMRPVAAPEQFIPMARPDRIWVTTNDNAKLMVEGPRLLGDTLVGFVAGRYEEILLPQTRWVGVRAPAPRRTAFLVAGIVLVGASLAYLLMGNGPGGGAPPNEDPSVPGGMRYPRGLR
jgi:hypothetical protein